MENPPAKAGFFYVLCAEIGDNNHKKQISPSCYYYEKIVNFE